MRKTNSLFLAIYGVILVACGPQFPEEIEHARETLPVALDYNLHVKPILSDRCFACHGPDKNKQKAGLRLDIEEFAKAELPQRNGEYAIVESSLGKSHLVDRILSSDPETVMPPPESNLTLSDREKAILIKWIEDGAEYKPHWAFINPVRPDIPVVKESDWSRNEIDRFILAEQEIAGFNPSPEAEKSILIRRVSFDLTGLPPTLEELDDFLADDSAEAYEKMVDHFLQKSAFGERMAAHWLDVARYADSHGYQDDGWRNMWPYRDWVIEKFNQNMPYDKFVTWQLAGDLLPGANQDQILATAFNRNHTQSQEGGIIPEEYRTEYVADRTQTLGKAFLGLTVECARCHDHKYDPISQKEYYQLFGFFNSVNEVGDTPYMGEASPTIILTDQEAEEKIAFIKGKISEQEQRIQKVAHSSEFNAWLTRMEQDNTAKIKTRRAIAHYPLDEIKQVGSGEATRFLVRNLVDPSKPAMVKGAPEDHPVATPGINGQGLEWPGREVTYVDLGDGVGFFDRNEPFSIALGFKVKDFFMAGPIFSRSGGGFNGDRGYELRINKDRTLSASLVHTSPDNQIKITSLRPLEFNEWYHLTMTYDGSGRASGLRIFVNGESVQVEVETDHLLRSMITYGPDKQIWDAGYGNFRIANKSDEAMKGIGADELMIFNHELTAFEVAYLATGVDPLRSTLGTQASNRTPEQLSMLQEYYQAQYSDRSQAILENLIALRGQENELYSSLQEVMVMRDLPEPRKTFILSRGVYDAPGDEVQPATPQAIAAYPDTLPANRLGLAQWLLADDNPLVARVAVNRLWQLVFGKGIVTTVDDFGNQGELPTHPVLLDWLAVEFQDSGWDIKHMLKLMVMSSTYRQSSSWTKRLLAEDPYNELYARAPSYRMPAEMIRDNALASSGLLVQEVGGPSVKPYQPDGLWKELATRNATEYVQDHGDELYRRSLYTIWKRTSPPPSMISFDASTRNFCEVKRQKTSTPLQSLVLLNDPQFIEAARVLAQGLAGQEDLTKSEKLMNAFRLLSSRSPTPAELSILEDLLKEELEHFSEDRAAAKELMAVGEYPIDPSLDAGEVAAYTVMASTLMNYDAAVFKR